MLVDLSERELELLRVLVAGNDDPDDWEGIDADALLKKLEAPKSNEPA